jgi:hypothetical protein
LKILELEFLFSQNSLNVSSCQKLVSCGENVWLWEKGEFLNLWSIFLGIPFSMPEFDLEIGNWVWFAKTNQVVAKNDPNMPN